MFHRNLKYFRLEKGLTGKALADKANLSPTAVSDYESGIQKPDMDTIKRLSEALEVRVSDFLSSRNDSLELVYGEFRKNSALTQSQQEFLQESVAEYFGRFMTAVDILGGHVLPCAPVCRALPLSADEEENAASLRGHLGLSKEGPIEDLTGKLENKGVLVYECDVRSRSFSGMNGSVNGRPYIVINPRMSAERVRSTIAHELAHLMFDWPEDMPEQAIEEKATAVSGAFLFPKSDALRELGIRRSSVTKDMTLIAKEYGISMMLLVKRSEIVEIIPASIAHSFFIKASEMGWRTAEPSRILPEHPALFEQLVYRAVNEQEISIQRGAELLKRSFDEVASMCRLNEV